MKVKKENSSALVATTSPHEVRKLVISKRLGSAALHIGEVKLGAPSAPDEKTCSKGRDDSAQPLVLPLRS